MPITHTNLLASLRNHFASSHWPRIDQIINSDQQFTLDLYIDSDMHWLEGHFPEQPVMPGVLIVEAMAQTAGAICLLSMGGDKPSLVYFMTIDNAKFRRPVVPGDRLELHVKKLKQRGNIWRFQCEGIVDGTKVAEAEISAMMTPKSPQDGAE